MKRTKVMKLAALGLSLVIATTSCTAKNDSDKPEEKDEPTTTQQKDDEVTSEDKAMESDDKNINTSLKEDFYDSVNGEWMESNEIPADKVMIGGFMDLMDESEEKLRADLDEMAGNEALDVDALTSNMLKYHKKANDFERLDKEGVEPILADLQAIKDLSSIEDLNKNLKDLLMNGHALPFSIGVSQDMNDATKYSLYAGSPRLSLGDKSYYEDGNQTGLAILPVYEKTIKDVMVLAGESEENAEKIAKDTIAFEKLYAPLTKSAEEASDFTKMYNPKSLDEVAAYSKNIDLKKLIVDSLGVEPDQVIVTDTNFFENFDTIVNAENWEMIKNWMYSAYVSGSSSYLSEDFALASMQLSMAMTGQTEAVPREERAYALTNGMFNPVIGNYYASKYFGSEAKADVENMVENMINVYKERLQNIEWLSEETKTAAAKKLDTMSVRIGYPDKIPEIYSKFEVDQDESLYASSVKNSKKMIEDNFAKYSKPVDRDEWMIGAHVVNAFYSPMNNSITFPAAILQAPFYSIDQTPSQNYGGIGAVIAHEISHAFDTNGSKYDELGNLNDWWKEEDYKNFEEKAATLIEQFNNETYLDQQINGTLTISENIADLGGLTCALEATKKLPDSNIDEFFKSWATIWRSKARPEYENLALTMDVHAPNKLRANVVASNLDEFYSTFEINEGDGMFRAPEDRISIW